MTTTSNSNTSQPGIGAKIKGAAQVVHGLGDNVRGSILGGVDTVVHQDSSQNDAIAAKGRAEHAVGAAKMKGGPVAAEYARPAGRQTDPAMQTGIPPQTGTEYSGGAAQTEAQVPYESRAAAAATGAPGAYGAGTNEYPTNQQGHQAPTGTQAPYDSHAPVPGTGAPGAYSSGPDAYPTKQQGYNATDAANQNFNQPHHDHAGVAQRIPEYDGPENDMQAPRQDRPAGEPQHHRDDAISSGPSAVDVGRQ
ncbi:hypothetical protein B0H17DRAFT_16308 [Mycena rosella]|uniref:CsbD-like domain-containing protein n=1 Tax=Mycena rosella TaxID=1033263 RepID=A0AAD7GB17_MYCRO|nr:hypothetical protein B0H17DRAFT_16308 [Mycena rosella]